MKNERKILIFMTRSHSIFVRTATDEKDGSGQKSKRHGARRHVTRTRLSANNQRLLPDEG